MVVMGTGRKFFAGGVERPKAVLDMGLGVFALTSAKTLVVFGGRAEKEGISVPTCMLGAVVLCGVIISGCSGIPRLWYGDIIPGRR